MSDLPRVTLVFAVAFAAVLIGPPEVGRGQFPPHPDMKWQDVLDLATPLIMLPLYWSLVRQRGSAPDLSAAERLAFLALGALWVEAQGMHLAANSIDNVIHEDMSVAGGPLTYFYDEVLSHYLWHAAMVGLMALALYRQLRHPARELGGGSLQPALAGLVYGLAFFIVVVEGGTGPLGIAGAILLALVALAQSRSRLRHEPVTRFVLVAHVFAVVLFAGWFVAWGGRLPQFTEVGLF